MKYLSICSGIEAATVAWHHMGWQPVAFSEIERFPSQVLAHHYPDVPNVGDMTKFKEWNLGSVDLLVGGTPCQSFSVAGLRKGMADPRGNLTLTFLAIADYYKPKWIVWENVPGVLSSNKGKDFESFLDGLEELGYILDCDILDAQFHGVAQRRRRVFVCAQHRDYLIKSKTNSSALTIAQCWQEILLSLLAKARSGSGKGQANLDFPFLSSDGAMRRMRLFGLAGETDCYEILRENLVEAFLKLPPEQRDWDAVHGKLEKEPMQADLWTDFPKDDLFTLTEQSLKKALDESYEVMKSCITSTTTNSITTYQIYISFQAVLVIAKLIQRLNPSSPPFWSAATSALTALQEYTNYARQTDSKLLGKVVGIQDWLYLIEQAERTEESLGGVAVECFGKIFPVSQSLSGNPAPSREKRQEVAKTLTRGVAQRLEAESETMIPIALAENTIGRQPQNGGNGSGFTIGGPMYTLNATGVHGVAQPISFHVDAMPDQMNFNTETSASLTCSQHAGIATQMAVRRLTPVEYERLQGFPDGYTDIWPNGKATPDSPRYKALGNSMAVPVMKWIGERIQKANT